LQNWSDLMEKYSLANLIKLLATSFIYIANKIWRIFIASIFPKQLTTKSSSNSVPNLPFSLTSSFSLDIWIDISLFLDVEERQRLLLVNCGIYKAIEKVGMQKLWRNEEQAVSLFIMN